MKQEQKKLVGYIFALAALAVLLRQLVSAEVLGKRAVIGTSSGTYAKIWIRKAQCTTDFS